MKRLALILVFLLLVGPTIVKAGNEDLFARAKLASWAIYVRDVGSLNAACSAIAYKSTATATYLLTAGHCFWPMDEKKDFLVTRDHKKFEDAELVGLGFYLDQKNDKKGHDWAVIKIKGQYPIIPLGDSKKLVLGEDIVAVGVPFGVDFLAVQGIVGSLNVSLSGLEWNHYFGLNLFIAGGNSGTGVISVKQQAIIGVIVAGPGSQTSLAITTPIHFIDWTRVKE